jgi:hypothetical protein
LTDQPISHLEVEYFIDGSSFVWDSTHFAGYAIMTLDTVSEAHLLLVRTFAQKVEFTALTWTLHIATGVG